MQKLLSWLFIILLIPALVSCKPSAESSYRGYLYFAKASYLARFSLRDGSFSIVENRGDKVIRDLSYFGHERLLISEVEAISRKEISRISWIDLKEGRSRALYSGTLARFLPDSAVIVYDDGLKLYAVSLRSESGPDEIISSHRLHQLTAMVVVSNDILLFEINEDGQFMIHSYDAITGVVQKLDALSQVCGLSGAVWISDLEKLACHPRMEGDNSKNYVLARLDGEPGKALSLPEGGQFVALTYVESQGILVLKEKWRSHFGTRRNSSVWAHDIRGGENTRIAKNQNLGSSVVYAEL
jgi:hypothetical protein